MSKRNFWSDVAIAAVALFAGVMVGAGFVIAENAQSTATRPTFNAVTSTPTAAVTVNVAVLVPWCEDTELDIMCGYYDEDDDGVNRYWVYPSRISKPNYRFAIDECTDDPKTCIDPHRDANGAIVHLAAGLTGN